MKKNGIYLVLAMAIAAIPLASCSNDDDEPKPSEEEGQHDPSSDADQTPVTSYDALKWLQGSLVVVDDKGEVVRRVYGKPLDRSDSTVIYIPVEDLADAEDTFLGWVAPDKDATQTGDGYDYTLTDPEGNNQGAVSFIAEDGGNGEIARMTVAPGTDLKQVTEVKFIKAESWPHNDAIPKYEAGKIYEMEDYVFSWTWDLGEDDLNTPELKSLPFYCIQGNTDGKKGILVWISPDSDNKYVHPRAKYYNHRHVITHLPSVPEAEEVLNFRNNNLNFWKKMLTEMDALGHEWSAQTWSNATKTSEFMLNETYKSITIAGFDFIAMIKCLDLDEDKGKICGVWQNGTNWYRYMHIKTVFPVAE